MKADLLRPVVLALRKSKQLLKPLFGKLSKRDGHRALSFLVAIFLIVVATIPLMADSPLTIQPSTKDTYIQQSAPTNNYGTVTSMRVTSYLNTNRRCIVEFAVDWGVDIPDGAVIDDATLSLYYYATITSDPVGRTYWIYKLTRPDWVEAQATWNIYKTGSSWTTAGGDYVTSSPSGASVVMPASFGWVAWNITAIAQDAQTNDINIEGLLRDGTEDRTTGAGAYFYTKEWTTASQRPKLVITYHIPVSAPIVVTNNATDVSYFIGTLNGNVTDDGGLTITTRGFEWDTDSGAPYANDWHEDGSFGEEAFSHNLADLSCNQTIYFRAYATNSEGTTYGDELDFTTDVCIPPEVTSLNATSVSYTTVVLNGDITATAENVTIRGFEWGTSTGNYTWSWNETGSFGTGTFSHDISALDADTTYYYRAWASNDLGTGYGSELTFTTLLPLPLAPTNFTAIQTGLSSGNLTWVMGQYAETIYIMVKEGEVPKDMTDGYLLYSGNGTWVELTGLSLGLNTYHYKAWSNNPTGYSIFFATTSIGGESMLLFAFIVLALGLTIGWVWKRDGLLGYLSAGGWLILGIYCYTQSAAIWPIGDIYAALFLISMGATLVFGIWPTYDRAIANRKPLSDEDSEWENEDMSAFGEKYESRVKPLTREQQARRRIEREARTGIVRAR